MDTAILEAALAHPTEHISWQFDCIVADLPPTTFIVTQFNGQQSLSESYLPLKGQQVLSPLDSYSTPDALPQNRGRLCVGFCYQIDLVSDQHDIDIDALLDQSATLIVRKNEQPVQYIHGMIKQFTAGNSGHRQRYYHLLLVPALERLALRHNMRIFQLQSAQDIIETLLVEMGITDYQFDLQVPSQQREFCVQYRQTDLTFMRQLACEEGWTFHFQHDIGQHTLMFTDALQRLPMVENDFLYHGQGGGVSGELFISQMQEHRQQCTTQIGLKDYSFKNPAQPLYAIDDAGNNRSFPYEHYDWGRHKSAATAKAHSQHQLQALQRDGMTASGVSNHPLIQAGYRIRIQDEFKSWIPGLADTSQTQWSVVQVHHSGSQPHSMHDDQTQAQYQNHFTLIPENQPWQGQCQQRPQADSLVNAIVVGPAGEEIFCDEYGRVKVHFLWDRDSKRDETSSPWIRVAQNWAGGKHGAITLPRIGDEVLISFLYGDPDQPIITGRAFHNDNRPPRRLPDNKTQSVLFRTHTHQGEGFNELRTEDQAGAEEIYLHGQKDFNSKILHDQNSVIDHDKTLQIGNDQQVEIDHDARQQIGNDDSLKVGNDQSLQVANNRSHQVGHNEEIEIGQDQNQVIKANQQLTIHQDQRVEVQQNQSLSIGADQHAEIGGSAYCSIHANADTQIESDYQLTVGNQFKLVCGNSSITLHQSGKVEITGTEIVFNGGKKIVLNSERLDLN